MAIKGSPLLWRTCTALYVVFCLILFFAQTESAAAATAPPRAMSTLPPATTANQVPTLGGDQYMHTVVRVGPVFSGVRFSLTTEHPSINAGTPPTVDLWISSATGKDENVCFSSFFRKLRFTVVDATGARVPSRPEPLSGQLVYEQRCHLPYFVQWRFPVNLNDYVVISKPGTYSVYATLWVWGLAPVPRAEQPLQSNRILLHVLRM